MTRDMYKKTIHIHVWCDIMTYHMYIVLYWYFSVCHLVNPYLKILYEFRIAEVIGLVDHARVSLLYWLGWSRPHSGVVLPHLARISVDVVDPTK